MHFISNDIFKRNDDANSVDKMAISSFNWLFFIFIIENQHTQLALAGQSAT